jgi:hypothetical protein
MPLQSTKGCGITCITLPGKCALAYAIHQYLTHSHTERNHQGLANQLITRAGDVGCPTGHVVRQKRLGGLLSYYHREAA